MIRDANQNLSEAHWHKLAVESAISESVIETRGYKTVTSQNELASLGFARGQQIVPCLLLPVHAPDGSQTLAQIRPDLPRMNGDKVIKYELPKDARMRLDCPPVCREMISDPKIPLWITEGIPKGDALASKGACAIALLGVWNFKGKNEFGGTTLLADLDSIAWDRRKVRIVFDSDVMTKRSVQMALERLTEILKYRKAHVDAVYLPHGANGEKVGVDDFLRENSLEALERLVTLPRPIPTPAPPMFELLDTPPEVMRRPLQLIDGKAYAATWLDVKMTVSESLDKTGAIIRHNPAIETISHELFIIRNDGKIFGKGTANPISEIGFHVHLPEVLPRRIVMSRRAIENYLKGRRPCPLQTFSSLVETFNRFLDFNRSLGDQRTMCELSACFVLATWFTEGFNTAGYIWATGEKGSGKTQLLSLICELAYLGQFIQASGSMATLRDLSDYGAFLGFDDAESVTDKNFDADKRNILLSGFRRGSQIPVKEPEPGGRGWRTRYVNTFTFRGFTATRKPDDILASRAITLPLVRTADKSKGDSDPLDYLLWERDPKELRDDLWQIGLEHISEIPEFSGKAKKLARLTGRDLEQWQAVLTVALWLDSLGGAEVLRREEGSLFERMNSLSVEYQSIRTDLEANDITRLVLRAIVHYIAPDAAEPFQIEEIATHGKEWVLTTKGITQKAQELIAREDLDFNIETTNGRRIGRAISKLRIDKSRDSKARGWRVTVTDLSSLLASYSLLDISKRNVINVTNDTNVIIDNTEVLENDVSDVSDIYDVINEPIAAA